MITIIFHFKINICINNSIQINNYGGFYFNKYEVNIKMKTMMMMMMMMMMMTVLIYTVIHVYHFIVIHIMILVIW